MKKKRCKGVCDTEQELRCNQLESASLITPSTRKHEYEHAFIPIHVRTSHYVIDINLPPAPHILIYSRKKALKTKCKSSKSLFKVGMHNMFLTPRLIQDFSQ